MVKKSDLSAVYDTFADAYDANRDSFDISDIIQKFSQQLPDVGHLLDLGCGAGVPLGRSFIDLNWSVLGVDFSSKMLALAKKQVPEMKTICSDICNLKFDEGEFDAISLIYSLFHVAKDQHNTLFSKVERWLKPGGKVLFTYATQEYTGSTEFDGYKEFMGQQLFYSHETPDVLYQLLENIGFVIISKQYYCTAGETFLWVTIQKPLSGAN
ncbi:hypothetical protein MNBD_GAMMA12-2751 [hydrothermal vent metagenome]|uniref:Methyltransferase domain-containing protein n=1 Tax=hydrothermal vent metagenome TaxID=652676 RepID=A0A3B0Z083_9ZZZZ